MAYERECVWRKRKCVCGVRERARGSGGRLERERVRERVRERERERESRRFILIKNIPCWIFGIESKKECAR